MIEKLEWARRSFARMQAADAQQQQADVQDHFWSFLHATQLIWFYFGRWVGSGGNPKARMKLWKSSLSPQEQQIWTALNELRSRDVHVQPVPTQRRSRVEHLTIGGERITVGGDNLVITTVVYEVELNGEPLDAFELCCQGIGLLERFIAEFDGISPPPP